MRTSRQYRRGFTLIQFAILMIVIFGFVALTVDYGLMVVTQRHLQNSTDAAAFSVGPDLVKTEAEMDSRATEYLTANKVTEANTNAITLDFDNGSGLPTYTVFAEKDVSVPFASAVANLVQGWDGYHRVRGKSTIQGQKGLLPGWIAPLAIQHSYLKDDMPNLWDKPTELVMKMVQNGNKWDYPSDPGTPWNGSQSLLEGNVIAIDVANLSRGNGQTAYTNAVNYYIQAMETGLKLLPNGTYENMVYNTQGNVNNNPSYWVSDLVFSNQIAWQDATVQAINNVISRPNASNPPDNVDPKTWDIAANDPRFIALLLINRTTGQSNFNCQLFGYVGFYVQKVYLRADGYYAIRGWFHQMSAPSTGVPIGIPPGEVFGLFTYKMIQ